MKIDLKSFKIQLSFLLLFTLTFYYSCKTISSKENKPEVVAEKFLNHLSMLEFDEARKYGTEATGKTLDMLSMMYELSKKADKEGKIQPKPTKIEIIKTAIDGKNAVVTYKNEAGEEQRIELIKVKGKWLVNMKKEMPGMNTGNKA